MSVRAGRDRVALACFMSEAILAGGNAVAIRFSNRELAPLWGAGLRFLLAGALLVVMMLVLRLSVPRGRPLRGALLYGVFVAGSFAFAYYSLVHIHAGLGQTLLALVPLSTLVLAAAQRQERLRLSALIGGVVALVGVGLVSGASLAQDVPALSLLTVLGGVFCFSEATVVARRFPTIHPVTMNAVGMVAAALLLTTASILAGDTLELPRRPATWIAIGYVAAVGSVVVFILYLVVVRLWGASRAAYTFVVVPIVTVLLSVWLDDEPIGVGFVLGGVLVLGGVYIGALRPAESAGPLDLLPQRREAESA